MADKKQVLIVPSNTDLNRGDQSLTWESINIAKELYPDGNIFLYRSVEKYADGVNVNEQTIKLGHSFLTRLLSHPKRSDSKREIRYSRFRVFKWGLRGISDLIRTSLLLFPLKVVNKFAYYLLSKDQKRTYNKFLDLDCIIVKGGGFLHSYGGLFDPYIMYFQLFDVLLANRLNKKIIILPNSIGPLKNRIASKIVLYSLSRCNFVFTREGVSHNFLSEAGIKNTISPDLGFYLKSAPENKLDYLIERGVTIGETKCIAITLRPYRFDGSENPEKLYLQYINQISKFIDFAISDNIHVTLMAHTIGPSAHEDDTIPLLEVYEKYKNDKRVTYLYDKDLSCRGIQKLYSYYDLVIGTRFHSVIFSLNVRVPSIAIAYGGNKAYGIMKDMNLEEFVVPIENPDAEALYTKMKKIFSNKEQYLKNLDAYRRKLSEQRQELIGLLKR